MKENDQYLSNICKNIRLLRHHHCYSIKKMCSIIHVAPETLKKIESGTFPGNVRCTMLYHIARHFQISIDSLFLAPKDLEKK